MRDVEHVPAGYSRRVTFNPIRWLERYVEWWDDRGRQNAAGPTPMHIYWMWVSWSVCAVVLITTLAVAAR